MVYSALIFSTDETNQYFQNVPVGKNFKLYTEKGYESSGMCITHFTEVGANEDLNFDAGANIDALQEFMPNANKINSEGIDYSFEQDMKLNFFIKNVVHPFRLYVEVN